MIATIDDCKDPASTGFWLGEPEAPGTAVGAESETGTVLGFAETPFATEPVELVVAAAHAPTIRTIATRRAERAPTPRVER
jgi:hypothetical protein